MVKKTSHKQVKTTKDKVQKHGRSVDYFETLIERLKDREQAIAYLNAAIEESLKGDKESQEVFAMAIGHVAQAHGNTSDIARKAKLKKRSLEQLLACNSGMPMQTFTSLLHAMGFHLNIS